MSCHRHPLKVLILCTGNSARSILGEYLLRTFGGGRFEVHSAGAKPTGRVNPFAIRVLRDEYDIDASDARSKSWDEFRETNSDYVITVCDNARGACPVWSGAPIVAHWDSPDQAEVKGTDEEKYEAFKRVAAQIARRAELLCRLSPESARNPCAVRAIGLTAPLVLERELASTVRLHRRF